LFITNDSGPMHMANALKIPVVAVFGPTDPSVTGPYQEPAVVIKKNVPCWPCSYRACPFDHRCMRNISSEEVYEACQGFLG
ncbi:MAG: glycosyltransferase family 9 protein, partial [Candidatus Aminicenantes bacterium]